MVDGVPASLPPDWAEPDPSRPVPFWKSIREDMLAHVPPHLRKASLARRIIRALKIIVRSSGFHVTLLYRIAHFCYHRLGLPGQAVAGFLFWFVRHAYGCSMASSARIYGGLILPHPQGLVVGGGSVIGPRAWLFHNVTFGGAPNRKGLPFVGRDARIFAGAVLVGPIVVGDNVMIGACAVVERDIPSRHVVRNPPPDVDPLPEMFINPLSLQGSATEAPR